MAKLQVLTYIRSPYSRAGLPFHCTKEFKHSNAFLNFIAKTNRRGFSFTVVHIQKVKERDFENEK